MLDFFCIGSELDIDTGWGRDQLLEFQHRFQHKFQKNILMRGKGLQGFPAKPVIEA